MNYPPGPYYFSSTTVPTSSTSDIMQQGHPAYSNPLRTTAVYPFQSTETGLGISYEQDHAVNSVRPCPPSQTYTANWCGHWMAPTLPFGCSLNTSHMSPATFYEPYSSSDASVSPLDYPGPHTMTASSSRGPALDLRTGPDLMSTHAYNYWPNTPCSDTEARIKEEPDNEHQDRLHLKHTEPPSAPLFAPVAQHKLEGHIPKLEGLEEDDTGDAESIEYDIEYNSSVEASDFPAELNPTWDGGLNSQSGYEQLKVPPASGLQCTICGLHFTRRSNCREHMKRHDPDGRKSFPCEECGKILGRKTDLKRHVDSVHRGIRKFGCDECGARFSRHDTLARHLADGCRRFGQRSSRPKPATNTIPPRQAQAFPQRG
ncbi:hypothetical protein BJY04DRAFT_76210 [Aspergillus karnatakaensis]|uniref:putative C2H2 finger domain protein (Ezf) n=1 Tax=Aspergillus karnatakaensis TaxID=1810916 RepID=UPI003CCDB4E9